MIYLYTGVPGAGKTLHMVSQLVKDDGFKDRAVYVDGIKGLDAEAVPHYALPDGCDGSNWHTWLPDGAVLVIDECQRYWRTRPNGSRVPDAVQAMETHRHRGVDIYLLTQDAKKIDSAIRGLIEVHKHFSMSQLGVRRCFEWRNKVGEVTSKADAKSAIITPYVLDKSVWDYYQSSVQHNDVKAKRSKWVYGLPVMLLLGVCAILWGAWSAYHVISGGYDEEAKQRQAEQAQMVASAPAVSPDNIAGSIADGFTVGGQAGGDGAKPRERIKAEDFKPDFEGQPWTAPVYAAHNQTMKTMPFPVACVKNGSRCTCYTDQATPIRGMDDGLCRDFVENGIYNPYNPPDSGGGGEFAGNAGNAADVAASVNPPVAGQVAQMGGKPLPSLHTGDSGKMAVIQ